MKPWQTPAFKSLLQIALAEDLDSGDATSLALIPDSSRSIADITAKSICVVAGQGVAEAVFREIDPDVNYTVLLEDGISASVGQNIACIEGRTASILAGERLALNFLQRMAGIATATRRMVDIADNPNCRIVDTRKTAPGLRLLDKYAVRMGGGYNHRMNLGDGILIKDNHIKACGSIKAAISTARRNAAHTLKIQIEVSSMSEAERAVTAGADSLLLDNMPSDMVRRIVERFGSRILLECSGNLTLDRINEYSVTGAHILSIGALTHSVHAADLSLNLR